MPDSDIEGGQLRAGVVGLGDIGRGLADNLVGAGVPVSVYDIRDDATDPYRERAHIAASPGDLAERSDVVLVAVVNDDQVRSVLRGDDGVFAHAAPGTTVVIVSTISTATVTELHAEGSGRGVTIVDCGVSGGPSAAASGELVCMVGGTAEDVERVRPLLDVISCLVLHMGPHGAGLSAKLARNIVQYGSWLAAFEAQELAEAAGIDLQKLGQAIKESDKRIGGASTLMFRTTAAPWPADADAGLVGAMRAASLLAHKDLAAALALGDELGVALPLATLTDARCDEIFGVGGRDTVVSAGPASVGSRSPTPVPDRPQCRHQKGDGHDHVTGGAGMTAPDDKRKAGMAKMQEVYSFNIDPAEVPGPYAAMTVDHLFGTVWTREALDVRDRRMLTIGVLAVLGKSDLLDIQFSSALEREELTVEQLRELVVLLTHYIGWPLSTGMNQSAETVIARRAKAAGSPNAD